MRLFVRRAATLAVVLLLGFLATMAIPGRSAVPQVTISTTLPPISTTLPVSTTLPTVPTTLPVTTTIPKVTTTIPKLTTTLPVTTAIPKVTTTLPQVTTALPRPTTTSSVTTVPSKTATSAVSTAGAIATGVVPSSGSSAGGALLFAPPPSGSSSTQPSAASASLFTASAGAPAAGSRAVISLRTARPFLSLHGPKAHRAAILVFRLRQAARVRFTVVEVYPRCRVVGSFTVQGHLGVNRFRFNGRVHGTKLSTGTYQIGLRTKRDRLLRVTIAIFDAPVASPSAVAAARKRNACGSTAVFSPFAGSTFPPRIEGALTTAAASSTRPTSHHVLGVDLTAPRRIAKEIGNNPLALAALGLAVLLLAAAAVPRTATPGGRTADLLVRERSALVLSGAVALAVGVIVIALS